MVQLLTACSKSVQDQLTVHLGLWVTFILSTVLVTCCHDMPGSSPSLHGQNMAG